MTDFADTEQMSLEVAALFTAMTEGMGLTHANLAKMFGVASKDPLRVIRRWCQGERAIPETVCQASEAM